MLFLTLKYKGIRGNYIDLIKNRIEFLKNILVLDSCRKLILPEVYFYNLYYFYLENLRNHFFTINYQVSNLWADLNLNAYIIEEQNYVIQFFSEAINVRRQLFILNNSKNSSNTIDLTQAEIKLNNELLCEESYNYLFEELLSRINYLSGMNFSSINIIAFKGVF